MENRTWCRRRERAAGWERSDAWLEGGEEAYNEATIPVDLEYSCKETKELSSSELGQTTK
jgi:hypothetical protein